MTEQYDLVVLGGGPAGYAASITAAGNGLKVCLVDRDIGFRPRPGETLHPGVEPLFDQLGIGPAVRQTNFLRFSGVRLGSKSGSYSNSYGSDNGEPWLGFQIPGSQLDTILHERAEKLSVEVRRGVEARSVIFAGNRVTGVETMSGEIRGNFVADCGGGRHWLARRLGIPILARSPALIAQYGYVRSGGNVFPCTPLLEFDRTGWTWTAKISSERFHWTRLNLMGGAPALNWLPEEFREYQRIGKVRRANVTWRRTGAFCGEGFLICGEAALVLDPSSSHGVLRALMSGILAGDTVSHVHNDPKLADIAQRRYQHWMHTQFSHDVIELSDLYASLPHSPDWVPLPAE